MNEWAMFCDDYKRPYSPLETEWAYREMYDDASAMGHILLPEEVHPQNAGVRLHRCSGCAVVYRLLLPGKSSHVWDAPSVMRPLGRCPASYDGVLAIASGEEGGLQYWGEMFGHDDYAAVVLTTVDDQAHKSIRYLQGRVLGGGAALFPLYCTPHMWQCSVCGRLVAKLSNPLADRVQLWVSYLSCSGVRTTLRGGGK